MSFATDLAARQRRRLGRAVREPDELAPRRAAYRPYTAGLEGPARVDSPRLRRPDDDGCLRNEKPYA